MGRYHYLVATLVAFIVFFEGYDTFNASYVIHFVAGPWHLRPGQAGLLVSSGIIGFSVAALAQGMFADRFGRRMTLIAALWTATIFSLCTAVWADSFWSFVTWRFLTGLGLGVLLPVSVAYMNEFAPLGSRATFATWGWCLGFSAGGVAASIVGVFVTPVYGWQSLYYLGATSIGLALVCHAILPESPVFLAMRRRHRDAGLVMARLNPAKRLAYLSHDVQFVLNEQQKQDASIADLLKPRYRRTTIAVSSAAFFVMFAIYGLTGWIPTSMMARGETFSTSFAFGAVILAMNFVGALACGYLMDRWRAGWSAPALWWLIGGLAVGALTLVSIDPHRDPWPTWHPSRLIRLIRRSFSYRAARRAFRS